ncbi:uncharacterized protein LOC100177666 [Ciona intestinalis]
MTSSAPTMSRKTPKNLFVISALLLVLLVSMIPDVEARSSVRIKRCGSHSKRFTQLVCNYSKFDFTFRFDQENLIRRMPLPSKRIYPFQYQAGKCCKIGCSIKEYRWMCSYHRLISKCMRIAHPKSAKFRRCRRRATKNLDWPWKL